MQNFQNKKQNQQEINNFSQMNYSKNINNASRAFGKDITNQVKYLECIERSNGCIQLDAEKTQQNPPQNNLVNIKTSYRGLRGKNQSMDDNLLKNLINKNVQASNFDSTREKPSYFLNKYDPMKMYVKPKANREEINMRDHKMEMMPVVNRLNLNSINSNNSNISNNSNKDHSLAGVSLPVKTFFNNYPEKLRIKNEISLIPGSIGIKSYNNNDPIGNSLNFNKKSYDPSLFNKGESIPVSSDVHMRTVSPLEEDMVGFNLIHDHTASMSSQPHEEYLEEIYANLLQEELSDTICNYMQFQDHINPKMRIILIEWIIDVSIKFKLRENTLFLTVHLIDRYLSLRKITRDKYQLLGACCMLVACKFEEIYFPELRDVIYICDKAYSGEDIIRMESEILRALDYKIVPVSPSRFLEIISARLQLSDFDFNLCNLMLELVIFDYDMVTVLPSLIACTTVYIAFKIKKISSEECNRLLGKFYNIFFLDIFPESKIKECAQSVCALLDKINLSCFRKIKEKFSKKEFCEVANFYYL